MENTNIMNRVKSLLAVIAENETYSSMYNRAKWQSNLPIAVFKGELVGAYGEKDLVVLTKADLDKVQKPIEEARKAVEEETLKAAERAGRSEEYQTLKTSFDEAKAALIEAGEYGLRAEEIPFGKELSEMRSELAKEDEELQAAQQKYWDLSIVNRDEFYGDGEFNSNRPVNLPKYFGALDGFENYWENVRARLPKWAFSALIFDSKDRAIKGHDEYNAHTNGTYCYQLNEGRSKDDEDRTAEDRRVFKLARLLTPAMRPFEVNLLDENLYGTIKSLIDAVRAAYGPENGSLNQYRVAYTLADMVMTGELSDYEFGQFTMMGAEAVKKFKDDYNQAELDWKRWKTYGSVDAYTGKLYGLDLNYLNKDLIFAALKVGIMDNLKYPVHQQVIAACENAKEVWDFYFQIPSASKKNPRAKKGDFINISNDELIEGAKEAMKSNSFAVAQLLSTKDMELNTGNSEWDEYLTSLRNELTEQIEAAAEIAATSGIYADGAQVPCVDQWIVRTNAAYKLLAEINEDIKKAYA